MLAYSRAKRTAVTGYACAAAGTVVFTQLDGIENLKMGGNILNAAVIFSMAATFGGFLTAIVASAIWARRTLTRQPLTVASSIGIGSFFLSEIVGVNIHGPSAILMFLVLLSVINILLLLVVTPLVKREFCRYCGG